MWGIDDYIALVVEVTDGVKPHIAKKNTGYGPIRINVWNIAHR